MNKQQKRSYSMTLPKKNVPSMPYTPSYHSPSTSVGQNFKDSLVSGLGTGIGFNIAERAVSSLFGGRKIEHVNNDSCEDIISIYKKALLNNESIPESLREKYNKCV